MKDKVSQRGCQGSALPASCTKGRSGGFWQWDLVHTPCGHQGVLGKLQENFLLENIL